MILIVMLLNQGCCYIKVSLKQERTLYKLGILLKLTYLDLSVNGFNNTIPSEIGLISHLKLFNVSLNQLTGTIPSALGLLNSLCK